MANKGFFGSSISINKEINFKGSKTEVYSHGKHCPTASQESITTPVEVAPFIEKSLGATPICSGADGVSEIISAALGSICASGTILVSKDSGTNSYIGEYPLSLIKVMSGAYIKNGNLTEDELKNLIIALLKQMLEKSGPAFVSYKQVLINALQNATLQDIMKGVQSAVCAIIKDPVNANTGNFIYQKEDLSIKGVVPMCFKRTYNCIDTRVGNMGRGWSHNYDVKLLIEEDRYIILWQDGREELYLRDESNTPIPLFSGFSRLKPDGDHYLYETQEKIVYTFNQRGFLIKQENSNGQGVSFQYDKLGRLSTVSNGYGSLMVFRYEGNTNLLSTVTDHTGRTVALTYELGRLKEVINANGDRYRYSYDENKNLHEIYNPKGICTLKNSYDDQRRTIRQTFADGGKILYDYQKNLNRTLMTEQNGNKVAYVHDDKLRNIKTIYVDGEETFRYNDMNQLISKTDKMGNKTKFSYDDKGNKSQIIYPDGAKYNMTYDAGNRLLVLSINGTTKIKNTFDAKGNLIETEDALGRKRNFILDEKGNILEIIQPDGSCIRLQYDKRGNITQIEDSMGNITSYMYDDLNRVIKIVDGNHYQTMLQYDICDRIICTTNADGKSRSYGYGINGKVTRVTDYNGAEIVWEYNSMNQKKSVTLPDGGKICMEYDLMQNVCKRIYPNGAEVHYNYDALNRLEQITNPVGGKEKYEYDPNGNRTAIIDAMGNRNVLEYDERGRVTAVTDSEGARTEYEYNISGKLIRKTNALGKSSFYNYDEAGQKISETDILGNIVKYDYDKLGNLSCVTDPMGHKTSYEYYPGGALKKITYANGHFEQYYYDGNKNLKRRENQKGDFLEYTYDCLDRMVKVKSSLGQEKSYSYDAVGNVTSMKDPMGNMTYYEYSPGGKLTSVIDAARNRTEYAYDAMGKLITVCQHSGDGILLDENNEKRFYGDEKQIQITHYKRNAAGLVETITDPLGLQEQFSYDLSGRMVLKRDQEGNETGYAYTPTGNIERITYADGRSVALSYNPLRQLMEIQDWMGTTKIEADDAGRATKITDYLGREVSYRWGKLGERQATIYPDGRSIYYTYDEQLRLSELEDSERKIQYLYNEDGLLSKKIMPEGTTSTYKYNAMGLLSGISHEKNQEILEQYTYEYDKLGNKTGVRKSSNMESHSTTEEIRHQSELENGFYQYRYDSLNHLTEVSKDGKSLHRYGYDAFGNRSWQETETGRINYSYNAANQFICSKGIFPEESYKYDARGNLIAILQGGKRVNKYIYDETNRLAEAADGNGHAAKYWYDGLGNRVEKKEYQIEPDFADNIITCNPIREVGYLLDLTRQYHNLLEKREQANGETYRQSYIWDSNVAFMTEGARTHLYLQDDLGSPVRLIEMGSKRQTIYGYDEFGKDLYGNQGEIQPFGYTGYQKDMVANSYFAQAREYRPDTGRFLAKDIIAAQVGSPEGLNYYNYCLGNPLNFIDLNGAMPTTSSKITEDELRQQLKAHYENDIGHKWERKYKPDEAIDIILEYDDDITDAANQYGIKKSYIQSVLFRELYCIGLDDYVDLAVIDTYRYLVELDLFNNASIWGKFLMGSPQGPILYREDSSTGYGQITAKTAMKAYNLALSKGLIEGKPYDTSDVYQKMDMWNKLHYDQSFNVNMVGMVLWYEKEQLGYIGDCELTPEQGAQVIGKYNGNIAYGQLVYKYVDIFDQYN